MAISSVTKTSTQEKQLYECPVIEENEQSYSKHDDSYNNNTKESCVYEQTRPKEPKYLAPLREWEKRMGFVTPIRWTSAILIILFHVITVTAFFYYILKGNAPKWQTFVFGYVMGQLAGFGVTAGVHRYWTHRSYKATLPLRIILIICYSAAGQCICGYVMKKIRALCKCLLCGDVSESSFIYTNDVGSPTYPPKDLLNNNIYNWVRDHRVHHKFSETSADPHDVRRGFFFSHVGWLMMKKHPDVIREGNKTDMSDIVNDPLVQFHTKYFNIFKIIFCFLLPTITPVYVWGDTWTSSIISQPLMRYMLSLNFTWSVNSFAHIWGNKPYDRNISPAENWGVSAVAMGEGWHNYHHTFPWDYKASELAYLNNSTTSFLNLFAKIGWAYDLKQASPNLVKSVIDNRGAKSHQH